jgi:nucleoside 2-deoxyribosyltransferase
MHIYLAHAIDVARLDERTVKEKVEELTSIKGLCVFAPSRGFNIQTHTDMDWEDCGYIFSVNQRAITNCDVFVAIVDCVFSVGTFVDMSHAYHANKPILVWDISEISVSERSTYLRYMAHLATRKWEDVLKRIKELDHQLKKRTGRMKNGNQEKRCECTEKERCEDN